MRTTNNKIDIHILTHHEHDRMVNLKRIERKMGKVPQFIDVHKIPGHESNIGLGRMEGFSKGSNPYVSFVDDDDDINPDIFEQCIRRLDENPDIDAVVTEEMHVIGGKVKKPLRVDLPKDGELYNIQTARYIHHLVVLRRSSLNKYIEQLVNWPTLCEFTLYGKMLLDKCKFMHIDQVGYYWFINDKKPKNLKIGLSKETQDLLRSMYQRNQV